VRGAERALGRLEGVHAIDAPVGALQIRILPATDRVLDFAAIRPALWREGIRARGITLVAEGGFEGKSFRIRGWPSAFPVDGDLPPVRDPTVRADVIVDGASTRLRLPGR